MKIKILKDVISKNGWRRAGEIHEMPQKEANHYIKKGIGVEYVEKEVKVEKETKEAKAPRRRTTKKAK